MSPTPAPVTETISSGHSVVWSRPPAERAGTDLVLVFHGYGSNEVRAARRHFPMLPERCTGLAVRGGFEIDETASEGPGDPGAHGWFLPAAETASGPLAVRAAAGAPATVHVAGLPRG